jgi:hypothetical protein
MAKARKGQGQEVRGHCARGFSSHGRGSEDEEGSAPPAKRPNSSLLEEALYVMGALAFETRANAHYMELRNEGVARRAT